MPEIEITDHQRSAVIEWITKQIESGIAEKIAHIVPLDRVYIVNHEPLIVITEYERNGDNVKEKHKLFSSEKLIHQLEDASLFG